MRAIRTNFETPGYALFSSPLLLPTS